LERSAIGEGGGEEKIIITVLDWKCARKRNERNWNGINL